jgi:ribonuclease BN (tRNA processing enzyme)
LSQVNNILLIHLSDSNSDEKQFKKEIHELTNKNVIVASNGMDIPFLKTPF